jgi:hypothetical protein
MTNTDEKHFSKEITSQADKARQRGKDVFSAMNTLF